MEKGSQIVIMEKGSQIVIRGHRYLLWGHRKLL